MFCVCFRLSVNRSQASCMVVASFVSRKDSFRRALFCFNDDTCYVTAVSLAPVAAIKLPSHMHTYVQNVYSSQSWSAGSRQAGCTVDKVESTEKVPRTARSVTFIILLWAWVIIYEHLMNVLAGRTTRRPVLMPADKSTAAWVHGRILSRG